MTEAEKARFREVHARQQIGYARIQAERDRELFGVVTSEAILSLRSAFEHATTLPMRRSSGLVQFYEAMKRTR